MLVDVLVVSLAAICTAALAPRPVPRPVTELPVLMLTDTELSWALVTLVPAPDMPPRSRPPG